MRHKTTLDIKYGKAGRSNGVIVGTVRLASLRSLGSIVNNLSFVYRMYIRTQGMGIR